MPKIAQMLGIEKYIIENKSDWFYEFPNGSQIWLGGLDDKERTEKVLGNEYSTIYYNEVSQITYDSVITGYTRLAENSGLVNKAYFDCNPPSPVHWTHRLFIEKKDPKTNMTIDENLYASMLMNPVHNEENLPSGYIDQTLESLPERQRRRFLLGEFVADIEGALWGYGLIEKCRTDTYPILNKIVIAIDPAVSTNKESDETGIIVVGLGDDNRCYVLEDLSGIYSPATWAKKAIYAYHKWEANTMIGEVNQGGDLVKSNIKAIDDTVYFKEVRAFKGKQLRAEPVVGLYEQNEVKHVGRFPELEEEQTTWLPAEKNFSPNRIDAMVYGVTELKLQPKNDTNIWV